MSQKEQMLRDIGIIDFALVELTLYLDTHPCDRNAIEYFNHYSKVKIKMEREFSQRFFPLRKDLAESGKDWSWGAAPLPWDADFPMEKDCGRSNKKCMCSGEGV